MRRRSRSRHVGSKQEISRDRYLKNIKETDYKIRKSQSPQKGKIDVKKSEFSSLNRKFFLKIFLKKITEYFRTSIL